MRDYGTGQWEGGSAECDHRFRDSLRDATSTLDRTSNKEGFALNHYRDYCRKCGAKRTDMQIGMEPSPDCGTHGQAQCGGCYVCLMVGVFREVYRVLRDDGTAWIVLGDTYSTGSGGYCTNSEKQQSNQGTMIIPRKGIKNIPPGNLVGIPWRVALALQADGWILRQDIIWYSPNKMPESVTNRCTKSHEHIFLLTKSQDYYYDAVAIEEETKDKPGKVSGTWEERKRQGHPTGGYKKTVAKLSVSGISMPHFADGSGMKNKRDVWVVPTQGYPGAHFAVYSPKLITPCILSGTSEHGCCTSCGRPWERVVSRVGGPPSGDHHKREEFHQTDYKEQAHPTGIVTGGALIAIYRKYGYPTKDTVGWRKVCGCRFYRLRDNTPDIILEELRSLGFDPGVEKCRRETE